MSSTPLLSIPGLIFASDIEAEQKRLRAQADAVNGAVQACGTSVIDPATVVAWTEFYTSLIETTSKTVHTIPWPWYWDSSTDVISSGNFGDTVTALERELSAWETRLSAHCNKLPPPFAPHRTAAPDDPSGITLWLKYGAIIAASLAGAYVVSQIVPPIVRLLPNRSSNEKKKNPLARSAGRPKSSGKALIAKATAVRLHMADGQLIKPRGTMMHDESGRAWPKNSLIIGPFKPNTHGPVPDNRFEGAPRYYLGRGYKARYGTVNLPPRSLSAWKFVGYASRGQPEDGEIQYVRRGIRAPGGFYHPWNKPMLFGLIQGGKGRVRLYRYGAFYRLEMPRGATVNDRGFVRP